ncbi:hypothetical protein [Rhodanobacter sp. C03]|uniref:hypothetical protein n=1 Tax=Rhodanobacter sp. C03 TaxID=1945858 RepID=UPI000985DDF6|nr:hypothetical protein [Rhodanobacter sp. C03]OOG56842.1 hypothetical protein B0E48_12210 [Rhodanobacter sp. C03]
MKSMKPWMASMAALLCIAGVHAAEMGKTHVIRDYTDTVAPADQQAYEAGVKSYNQCLGQHGFKYAWVALLHETGDTYRYSYISDPSTWETFDAMHTAGKACDQTWRTEVNPHLKSETSAFLEPMPELTYMPGGMPKTSALTEVTYFKLKPGHDASEAFTSVARKIAAAAEKSKWSEHFMIAKVKDGDQGAPDFMVVSFSRSWADFGEDANPTLWKMVENTYGKEDAAALRKSLNDAIQDVSSHVDSYSADLTYQPSGK